MRITKKFLALTKFTYPHGKEHQLLHHLPEGYQEDGLGNYYIQIGGVKRIGFLPSTSKNLTIELTALETLVMSPVK